MGKFNQDAAAAAPPADGAAATPATRARAPRQAKPAADAMPDLFLVAGDDVRIPLVPGTPIHKRAVALLEANYAE